MKRTFIAIDIPANNFISTAFNEVKASLRHQKIKWTDAQLFHLTLKFLGDTENSIIPSIIESLKSITKNVSALKINLQGAGVFQNYRNPKVIWLGIKENENLISLQVAIDKEIQKFGYEAEQRKFSPHLTLGRIKWMNDTTELKKVIEKYKGADFGEFLIDQVIFYESILTPSGPIYKTLETFSL
ncbi:MAG: RNA 2',3'-cyclic phosphodiesterase [Bacteroidales bacterium]|nr:RNA 2',3'-cyclic phosphodiesterase [Bacteroidales bacterium]